MVFFRYCFITVILCFCIRNTKAQTIYYPAQASQLLQSTADDIAMLLQKAIKGSSFNVQSYSKMPATGIIFVYDSAISDNQACKVESNGSNYIKLTAAEDNGLNFGIYQYFQKLGFRFYQPGTIWETIPTLSSPFKNIDTSFTCRFKYKNWFITGGHNLWAMDRKNDYPWDSYFGENGHQWALYQRRNGMTGSSRFTGHRDDLMTGNYLAALQNNPCYVACYEGSRTATMQSVADIHNNEAVQLWQNTIQEKYNQFKNIIFSNTSLYANYYRNFNYNYQSIGIEVPDGAHWGNTKDVAVCNSIDYPKESDQQFTLADLTVKKLHTIYPDKRFQLYAYSSHADIPSSSVPINSNLDIQVVSTGFQFESSPKGLLNRWYNKTSAVSEYHYLNLSQWGGETPTFFLHDLTTTVQRVKDKNSQGIVWEASPAKFASLPFLLAANNSLVENTNVDSTLHDFCNALFGNASGTIYTLLQLWSDDRSVTVGDYTQDNKYKVPLYFQVVNKAVQQTQNAPDIVKQRIRELKAYLHYMSLYYDWMFDQRPKESKTGKAAAVCLYLAKINKLQIVNSYFLIADITNRYAVTDPFYLQYNAYDGTTYQNGDLPLITNNEIDADFAADINTQGHLISQYTLENADAVKSRFAANNLTPLKKINVKIGYTNGTNYPNRSEFYIIAPGAGNFTIQYTPHFNMPGKGYINFTTEATESALQIVKDFSIDNTSDSGTITISLPAAGKYKLSVVSKYQSGVDLVITTNKNYFYRNGPYLGNTIENYRADLLSLPGYFYVPAAIGRVYFSVNNSNPGGQGFATPGDISKAFIFQDNNGNTIEPNLLNASDSALFYLDIPAGNNGCFWKVIKMEQYRLCFANISNLQWYAEKKSCSTTLDFSTTIINKNNDCITQLTKTAGKNDNLQWQVTDGSRSYFYTDQAVVELPNTISPNAVITLTNNTDCAVTKRIGDDTSYLRNKEACASGASLPTILSKPFLYPNPGSGVFNCRQNSAPVAFDKIIVYDSRGVQVANFSNTNQFNISGHPSGVYFYRLIVNEQAYQGKLIKL